MLSDKELLDELLDRFDCDDDGVLTYRIQTLNKKFKAGDVAGTVHQVHGGIVIAIHRKIYQRGRLVWLLHHGELPYRNLKHRNGIQSDDRIENLYECESVLDKGYEPKTRINLRYNTEPT